jgi:hypothetical protein
MKRLLSLLACCGALYADFDVQRWTSRCPVKTGPGVFNAITVDGSVYQSSDARLRDLRVVHADREVPYVLKVLSGERQERILQLTLINKAAIRGVGVQAVLRVDAQAPHDRVTINTNRTNFKQTVRIETSDDGQKWGLVRRDGVIFDVSNPDQHVAGLSVSYPESTRRFLRITIAGWNDPSSLQSASVSYVREEPAIRDVAAELRPSVQNDAKERTTNLEFDLSFSRPYDRITLKVGPGLFSRAVTVWSSTDRQKWSQAGGGLLARSATREQLTLAIPEQWERYVRVSIRNEDNAPLNVTRGRFEALRREVIFALKEQGEYWLYTGNAAANAPQYDLASVIPFDLRPGPATLGASERNPRYQAPQSPITERSPWLLTGLVIVLVPLMGWLAFRMLRQTRAVGS